MADALKGAVAPVLPAALAVSFSPDSHQAIPPKLSDRMDKLCTDAAGFHALVTVTNDFLDGDNRGGVLRFLAERLAALLRSELADGDWSGMARAEAAEWQGGAA